MADKASRSLVIHGDGLAKFINTSSDDITCHLHSFASKSACGFLTLPNSPLSESPEERIVREFALLLDSYQAYFDSRDDSGYAISARFMGMKAAVITDNPFLKSFASKLGFVVVPYKNLCGNHSSISQSSVDFVISDLLKLLGFEEGKTLETSQFDMVFMHVGNGEGGKSGGIDDVQSVNALVGSIMHIAHPGSDVRSRLHLSVVMSYGDISNIDAADLSVLPSKDNSSDLAALFPCQSYTMRGEKPRNDVRHHCPMLVAQLQDAVTRVDLAKTFSFEEFKEHGVNLAIPADRFLHEISFKLWKAPKYGA